MYKIFKAKIKEKGRESILTPEYWGDEFTTMNYVEELWGVHNEDVEWYDIQIDEPKINK